MRSGAEGGVGRPPRLSLVTETWLPEINGVAMTLGRLVDGLVQRNWEVQVIRPKPAAPDNAPSRRRVEHVQVPGLPIPGYPGLRFGLPFGWRIRAEWRNSPPDLVHIATEGPLGWAALRQARSLGLPVTSGFHTNFHGYCRHYGLGWLHRSVSSYLRAFHNDTLCTMAPDSDLCRILVDDGYRNVEMVGRGVDCALFHPMRRSDRLRASFGAGPATVVALYVGRLAPEKNLDLVAEAFARLRAHFPDARMVWVGSGPEESRLRKRHPGHHFAGVRTGEALAAHYASADLFLFPSMTETFGNVVLEAMASGLAVLAFNRAAAAAHIRHGVHGLLAMPGDRSAFLHLADGLAGDVRLCRAMGAQARRAALHLGWDAVCGQFSRVLGQAILTHESNNEEKFLGEPLQR